MKFSEIAHLEKSELRQRLHGLRRKLFDFRMQLKMKRLANPLSIRLARRDIARLQTALSAQKKSRPAEGRLKAPAPERRKSLEETSESLKKQQKKGEG